MSKRKIKRVTITRPCSGCHETVDGHPVSDYPYDEKSKCHVGLGCKECGYTGKRRNTYEIPVEYEGE